MRLRRWRVVASFRVFPFSSRCRPCLRLRCFFSFLCTCGAVGGSGSCRVVPFTSVHRFVHGSPAKRHLCAERVCAPALRAGAGLRESLRSSSVAERCCCEHSATSSRSARSGVAAQRSVSSRSSSGSTHLVWSSPGATGQFNRGTVAPGRDHGLCPQGGCSSCVQR